MRGIIWAMVVLVGVVGIILSSYAIAAADDSRSIVPFADVVRITAEDLNAKLGDPDVIVLDVRPAGQWERSDQKIAGAVREDHLDVEGWAGKYPHDKILILYCG